jgi:hypothetical protein
VFSYQLIVQKVSIQDPIRTTFLQRYSFRNSGLFFYGENSTQRKGFRFFRGKDPPRLFENCFLITQRLHDLRLWSRVYILVEESYIVRKNRGEIKKEFLIDSIE